MMREREHGVSSLIINLRFFLACTNRTQEVYSMWFD